MTRPTNERVAQALLGSFSRDEVPAQAKERAFGAFGVAAGMASASPETTGAAADVLRGAANGATIVAKSAISVGAFSMVKGLIVGAAVGAVVMHAAQRVATHSRDTRASSPPAAMAEPTLAPGPTLTSAEDTSDRVEADPPPVVVAHAIPAPSAPVEASRARSRASARVAAGSGATPEAPPSAPSAASEASVRPSSPATLTGEVVRLDRSRAALREGSPSRAMRELDAYDAEFATGALRQEATVLRIEVLVEMGDDVRARALADAFAAAHPRSGYLHKIRELLARRSKRPAP